MEAGQELIVPPGLDAGVYAHAASVWHSRHEFTLDFVVQAEQEVDHQTPWLLVSRVRVPPTAVFDLLRHVSQNLSEYEARWGHIPPQE